MRRRSLAILLIVCLAFSGTVLAKLPKHPESITSLYSGDRPICTTWSLNKAKGLWMTAAHCVVYEAEVEGVPQLLENGNLRIKTQPATVVKRSQDLDLALLQADVHEAALKFGRYPQIGDLVTVYGMPGGWQAPLPTWLRVCNTYFKFPGEPKAWMVLDGSIWPGHSGSPVLDDHRDVIAVAQAHGTDRYSGATFTSTWIDLKAFTEGFRE